MLLAHYFLIIWAVPAVLIVGIEAWDSGRYQREFNDIAFGIAISWPVLGLVAILVVPFWCIHQVGAWQAKRRLNRRVTPRRIGDKF